ACPHVRGRVARTCMYKGLVWAARCGRGGPVCAAHRVLGDPARAVHHGPVGSTRTRDRTETAFSLAQEPVSVTTATGEQLLGPTQLRQRWRPWAVPSPSPGLSTGEVRGTPVQFVHPPGHPPLGGRTAPRRLHRPCTLGAHDRSTRDARQPGGRGVTEHVHRIVLLQYPQA